MHSVQLACVLGQLTWQQINQQIQRRRAPPNATCVLFLRYVPYYIGSSPDFGQSRRPERTPQIKAYGELIIPNKSQTGVALRK